MLVFVAAGWSRLQTACVTGYSNRIHALQKTPHALAVPICYLNVTRLDRTLAPVSITRLDQVLRCSGSCQFCAVLISSISPRLLHFSRDTTRVPKLTRRLCLSTHDSRSRADHLRPAVTSCLQPPPHRLNSVSSGQRAALAVTEIRRVGQFGGQWSIANRRSATQELSVWSDWSGLSSSGTPTSPWAFNAGHRGPPRQT